MKIGILTHYDVNNQGAQLQMYSMYKKIEELGHEPIILTYTKNYDFDKEKELKYKVSIKSIPFYLKHYLIDFGIYSLIRNYKKYKLNINFRNKEMKFDNYATANIDMVIIGSDEVFSIPMGINIMMYGHAVNTNKVISYAPSFGQTDIKLIEKRHCKSLIASGISRFIDISARDENTYTIIKELTGRDATIVCDPAILYDLSNISVNFNRIPKQKYVIVYAYDKNFSDKKEVAEIKRYAKKNNLITISPGTYHKWCDKNISCNILEWIELFRNAECVITDTFHGTIIATITNRPLAVSIRNELNSNKMVDLLKKLHISERRMKEVTYEELEKIFSSKMNYSQINNEIKKLRENSNEYLKRAIEKCS